MTLNQLTLADAISNVIEELAMMATQTVNEFEEFTPTLQGWIDFTGPVNGKLSIRCRESLAQMLASNLLGMEPGDLKSNTVAWDALAELLNVVCGNLVSSLYDSEKIFTLTPPQVDLIDQSRMDDKSLTPADFSEQEVQRALILLDNEPAEFMLTINKAKK
jgi:CheY-specific phosphatase CheX